MKDDNTRQFHCIHWNAKFWGILSCISFFSFIIYLIVKNESNNLFLYLSFTKNNIGDPFSWLIFGFYGFILLSLVYFLTETSYRIIINEKDKTLIIKYLYVIKKNKTICYFLDDITKLYITEVTTLSPPSGIPVTKTIYHIQFKDKTEIFSSAFREVFYYLSDFIKKI